MTRVKKRMLLGLLGVLIIAGGWYYYLYFMSTNAAIHHAEAFLTSAIAEAVLTICLLRLR